MVTQEILDATDRSKFQNIAKDRYDTGGLLFYEFYLKNFKTALILIH